MVGRLTQFFMKLELQDEADKISAGERIALSSHLCTRFILQNHFIIKKKEIIMSYTKTLKAGIPYFLERLIKSFIL